MTLLHAKDVTMCFGERTIVQDVSFELNKGEVIGLVGPNGVGKSTLMKGLARLLPLHKGEVYLKDQKLSLMTVQSIGKSVSYLAQGDVIHWPLEVEKLVALGRLPFLSPWQPLNEEDHKAVQKAMEVAEVTHLSHRIATKLSGGEKRLVLLARALAVEADIFLADEPVSGLDPNHQIQVMELLRKIAQQGQSVVIILHDLTLAARYCDRLYLMKEGKVHVDGKPKDILTKDNLKDVYGITAKYGTADDNFYVVPWDRSADVK